ncbi:reverse transcriptase-like protein [Novosphingobium lentum]|uniref:reverse transcriptase-like protein n=1 Tax=Novosphingobium lentum TaxID=145287 RepID=UPI000A0445D9|nr:reverse transcriptase-like protein [Novosphingobium lentum]
MQQRRLKVFFDGGCRPNPGRIEAAVVARGVVHVFDNLGTGSNGDAEWLALLCALEVAHALGTREFELIGDAVQVIDQANGVLKCRSVSFRSHLARFEALCLIAPPARIRWIRRAQNLAGIALAARHER